MGFPLPHSAGGWAGLLAVVLGTGCAPRPDQPPEAAPPPPAAAASTTPTDRACELLPRPEAEAVLGSPIEDLSDESNPTQMGAFQRSSCFYRGAGGSVQLILHTFSDSGTAATRYDGLRKRYSPNDSEDVEGLGERAFAYHEELTVLVGRRHLMVKLLREGAGKITSYSDAAALAGLLAEERPIAAKAIERLPAS